MKFAIAIFLIAVAGFADDSPLVKAAKANGGPKKSKTKVITNADVKKSLGRDLSNSAANVSVNLIPPSTLFSPRRKNVDVRVSKILRYRPGAHAGRARRL